MTWYGITLEMLWNSAMPAHASEFSEPIDRKTSWSICNAVGERLQRSLPPEPSDLSGPLQSLMDELRKRDDMPARFG